MEFDLLLLGIGIGGFIELCRWGEGPEEPIVPNEYGPRPSPPPQGSGEPAVDYAARLFRAKVAAADHAPFYGR